MEGHRSSSTSGFVREPVTVLEQPSDWIRSLRAEMIDGERHFKLAALSSRRWCVAVVPDSITDDIASRLASAARRRSCDRGLAITTQGSVHEQQLVVPLTAEGFIGFEFSLLLRYFLLVPENEAFALLHEANYYWLLAGPPTFIVESLGMSPAGSIDQFLRDYANLKEWPARTRDVLREVQRYRDPV